MYETLRSRVAKARKGATVEQMLEVVDAFLGAVGQAAHDRGGAESTCTGQRSGRGTYAVDLSPAEAKARRYGVTLPFLEDDERS